MLPPVTSSYKSGPFAAAYGASEDLICASIEITPEPTGTMLMPYGG